MGLSEPIIITIIVVVIFAVPIVTALLIHNWYRKRGEAALEKILTEHEFSETGSGGFIQIEFVTYFGFIGYTTQTTHTAYVKMEEAEQFVQSLHRYNMKFCWLAYGALFIPLLSWRNLRRELKKIEKAKEEKDLPPDHSGKTWEEFMNHDNKEIKNN